MIIISAQYGGPKADRPFKRLHYELNKNFDTYMTSDRYFENIRELSIVFRVSADISDFNGDGPEFLKYDKSDQSVTIDLTIPYKSWLHKSTAMIEFETVTGVRQCISLLLEAASNKDKFVAPELFFEHLNLALSKTIEN